MSQENLQTQVGTGQELEYKQVFSVVIFFEDGPVTLPNQCIQECYFVENIFSLAISGKLRFADFQGLFTNRTFIGTEMITIVYGVESDIYKNFFIYKINDYSSIKTAGNENVGVFEILFVDLAFQVMNQKQISYAWLNQSADVIIKDLLKTHLNASDNQFGLWEKCNVEESREKDDQTFYYYSPYWTISQNIKFLLPRVSTGDLSNRRSGVLFYSSTNNEKGLTSYNLVSLYTLLNQREKDLMKVNENDDSQYLLSSRNNEYHINKILDWNISTFDVSAFRIIQGGKLIGFNQITKEPIEKSYTYKTLIDNTAILGNYSLFPDFSNDKAYVKVYSDGNENILDNIFYSEWLKRYCLQQTITITVYGHEKRYCGGMITIPWVKGNQDDKSGTPSESDERFNGGFLVKSVTHYFTAKNPGYFQKLVLIKNGYDNINSMNLVKQENKNLANVITNSIDENVSNQSGNIFNPNSSETIYESGLEKKSEGIIDSISNIFSKIF